jgi:hypothetical protein
MTRCLFIALLFIGLSPAIVFSRATMPEKSCVSLDTVSFDPTSGKNYTFHKEVKAGDRCIFNFNTVDTTIGTFSKADVTSKPKLGVLSVRSFAEYAYDADKTLGVDSITWKLCKTKENGQEGCSLVTYTINIIS